MGWKVFNSGSKITDYGLKLVEPIHYDKLLINILINRFEKYKRGSPKTICKKLRESLNTGIADFELICRLSKWCTWDAPIQEMMARRISFFLFGDYCKRLKVRGGNKLTSTYKDDYLSFINRVAMLGNLDYLNKILRRTDSMDEALTTKNKVISAKDAEPGNYFCKECHDIVHWRNITNRGPQFYHWRRNPECPLSSDDDGGWDEDYYKKNLGINYKERWIETIDELRCFGNFEWLNDKEWAINPLKFYLSELEKNRPNEKDTIFDTETLLKEIMKETKLTNIPSDKNNEDNIVIAKKAFKNNDYNKTIEYYSNSLLITPTAFAYNGRGRAFWRIKEINKALNDFNKALELCPEYGAAYNNLGVVYLEGLKNVAKSLEFLNRSLEFNPYSIKNLTNIIKAYYKKGEYNTVKEECEKTLDIPSINKKEKNELNKILSMIQSKSDDEENKKNMKD